MKRITMLLTAALAFLFSGCTSSHTDYEGQIRDLKQQIQKQTQTIDDLKQQNEELTKKAAASDDRVEGNLLQIALAVAQALKEKNMEQLSLYVDSEKGVRFSPYGHVNVKTDLVFTPKQLPSLMESGQTYQFGEFDGSGEPIKMTFGQYFDRFVYDVDFANPQLIGNNVIVGKGNTLQNIQEAYPNSAFVEFHFTGFDKQYDGMDWRSLRLVFEQRSGVWCLVGIVHDQWTA
ncbi:hypothetical protein [Anoxybacteroides rupiense]|uniref:hypothetical protein n=1 Tax=Anoxybacteroides rupiense TaxID=311460 RepID=UPI001606D39A|nr:hypothetical protein [Anoxybacillus rupiensis]MBB3907812.1 cell division protein FtsB [Anoxybacillus rupiensis]